MLVLLQLDSLPAVWISGLIVMTREGQMLRQSVFVLAVLVSACGSSQNESKIEENNEVPMNSAAADGDGTNSMIKEALSFSADRFNFEEKFDEFENQGSFIASASDQSLIDSNLNVEIGFSCSASDVQKNRAISSSVSVSTFDKSGKGLPVGNVAIKMDQLSQINIVPDVNMSKFSNEYSIQYIFLFANALTAPLVPGAPGLASSLYMSLKMSPMLVFSNEFKPALQAAIKPQQMMIRIEDKQGGVHDFKYDMNSPSFRKWSDKCGWNSDMLSLLKPMQENAVEVQSELMNKFKNLDSQ
jgi:hypothetical protein